MLLPLLLFVLCASLQLAAVFWYCRRPTWVRFLCPPKNALIISLNKQCCIGVQGQVQKGVGMGTNTNIKVEAKAKTSVKSTGAVVKLKYHLVQLYQ